MSIKSFMSAFRRATSPLRGVPPWATEATKSIRLDPEEMVELELHVLRGEVILDLISSISGSRGHASTALEWLCGLADRHDVNLVVNVAGDRVFLGGYHRVMQHTTGKLQPQLSCAQLRAWYRRHGFVTFERKLSDDDYGKPTTFNIRMRRSPQTQLKGAK